jgi:hypothetical protein
MTTNQIEICNAMGAMDLNPKKANKRSIITLKNMYKYLTVEYSNDEDGKCLFLRHKSAMFGEKDGDKLTKLTELDGDVRAYNLDIRRNCGWSKIVKDKMGWKENKRSIYGTVREKHGNLTIIIYENKEEGWYDFMIDEHGFVYMKLLNMNYIGLDEKHPSVSPDIMWRVNCLANDDNYDEYKNKTVLNYVSAKQAKSKS